jgi:hypothetical protein
MEDALDVYPQERDENRPPACVGGCPEQLIGETRSPLPAQPGFPACFGTEYVRGGSCDIFMFAAPLEGRERVVITGQRTGKDWAGQVKRLGDGDFPVAEKIILVMGNLNTIAWRPCMKHFQRKKRNGCGANWSFITRRNTGAG